MPLKRIFLILCAAAFSRVLADETAQPKATAQVRQADESDLIVKEWHSPITFDLDAGWIRTLPPGGAATLPDLPTFYCDGVTMDRLIVRKGLTPAETGVDLTFESHLRVRKHAGDKLVGLEFTLVGGEQRVVLGHRDDLAVSEGESLSSSALFRISKKALVALTPAGAKPQLRISVIVHSD